jgi:PAS domain S-box-containing protein
MNKDIIYKDIYDKQAQGIAIINADFIILDANPAFADLLNLTYEQLINRNFSDFLEETDINTLKQISASASENSLSESVQISLRNNENRLIPCQISLIFLNRAEGIMMISVSTSDNSIAAEPPEMLHRVLDSLDALVYVADMETYEVLFVNKYTKHMFGDITGKLCWETIQYNQTGPCPFCTNRFLIDTEGKSTGVYTWNFINTINGRWYHIQDRAIQWVRQRLVRMEIAVDITDRKEAEEKLELRTKQLESLNQDLEKRVLKEIERRREQEFIMTQQSRLASMGEMINAIAHRWRQPLNTVGLMLQRLPDMWDDGLLDRQYLLDFTGSAMSQISVLSETIDEFRVFFKPTTEKQTFNVKEKITEALTLLGPRIQNDSIHIETFWNKNDSVSIDGYAAEFQQVIVNLINNACDAIADLRASEPDIHKEGKINIYMDCPDSSSIIIRIEDNGGGISPEIRDRIFEPYFTTKETHKGVGLGLYVARMIIERSMGGRIEFTSGDGLTVFTVLLKRFSV